jgi:hypothetical protein
LRTLGFRAGRDALAAFLTHHAHKSRLGPDSSVSEELVALEHRARTRPNFARRTTTAYLGAFAAADRFDWASIRARLTAHSPSNSFSSLVEATTCSSRLIRCRRPCWPRTSATLRSSCWLHCALRADTPRSPTYSSKNLPAVERRLKRKRTQPDIPILDELGYLLLRQSRR